MTDQNKQSVEAVYVLKDKLRILERCRDLHVVLHTSSEQKIRPSNEFAALYPFPITAALMLEKAAEAAEYVVESHGKSYMAEDVCGAIRNLIPTDAQAALDAYVRERCMEVATKVHMAATMPGANPFALHLGGLVNTVISEMRGK